MYMIITLCIPCVDKHIPLLLKLLSTVDKFTRKPDKIMIGLSPKFNDSDLFKEKNEILKLYPELPIDIIVQTTKTNAAKHLNIMGKNVKEGYIIRADADDIIHPQKIEIIEQVINKYPDTKLILHRYTANYTERDYTMKNFILNNVIDFKDSIFFDVKYGNKAYDLISEDFSKKYNKPNDFLARSNWIVNGANSYSCSVFSDTEYKDIAFAEDSIFNKDLTIRYKKTIFLDLKLVDITSSRSWRN